MPRRAKIYKRNKPQKKKVKTEIAPSAQVLQVRTADEKAQATNFNHRVQQAIQEDLLDRL